MDFVDMVRAHAKRVSELRDIVINEESTKTSLIMPFFQLLGYDPSDPRVVIPEYYSDFGEKKECRVDFAIKRGGDIVIIVEAKRVGDALDGAREAQLQKYFQNLLSVKIAVLTDGVVYKFFTDLENVNVMDKKPFMTFDFSHIEEGLISELQRLCNDCFDTDRALSAAQELKYLGQLKKLVSDEMGTPSDEMVRLFAKQVYEGKLTNTVVEAFRERLKMAFEHHVGSVINARLENAKQPSIAVSSQSDDEPKPETQEEDSRIITTPEEIEGYHIVRAIMSQIVDPEKVVMRDTISYCGILFENNNRKPICRLHFNSLTNMQLETFDSEKKGTRYKLEKISDIYKYAEALQSVVGYYSADGDKN